VLREDNRAIIRAASRASKAADYLLAFLSGTNEPSNTGGEAGDERSAA
jgi:antirestriction protein ArdC